MIFMWVECMIEIALLMNRFPTYPCMIHFHPMFFLVPRVIATVLRCLLSDLLVFLILDLLEEKLNCKKTENGKSNHRRLKKKYQLSESDDDLQQPNIAKGSTGALVLESDSEDNIPISSLYKSETIGKNEKLEEEEKKAGNGIGGKRGHKKLQHGKTHKDTENKENAGAEKDCNHSIESKRENNAINIGTDLDR